MAEAPCMGLYIEMRLAVLVSKGFWSDVSIPVKGNAKGLIAAGVQACDVQPHRDKQAMAGGAVQDMTDPTLLRSISDQIKEWAHALFTRSDVDESAQDMLNDMRSCIQLLEGNADASERAFLGTMNMEF
eukprot:3798572-Alexandrium_andersonii.AAC.1